MNREKIWSPSIFSKRHILTIEPIINLIAEIHTDLILDYEFLSQWTVSFDNAKRRAGICRVCQKQISISRWHVEHNTEEVIKDTILHEFAHAITYELHRDIGHGEKWKSVAKSIGTSPRATGVFEIPSSPWMLVTACRKKQSVVKIAPRYRKNRNIKDYFIKGKPESKGQLYYLKTEELLKFEESELLFEELNLVQ